MSNPFDHQTQPFLVLINEESQYSLWPALLEVPSGWRVVYGEESKENCLTYINTTWKKSFIPDYLQEVEPLGNEQ